MLEARYNTDTKQVTAWCGDSKRFGNLERVGHTVVILDISIPSKPMEALLYDEATESLIPNPDYVEPEPARDLVTEIDEMKAEIEKLKEVKDGT